MGTALTVGANQFLTGMELLNNQINQVQQQVSSGKRVSQPSDSPGDVVDIFTLNTQLSAAQQTQSNLQNVQSEVNTGESALQTAVQELQSVTTYGAEGASTSTTADQRTVLSQQVESVLDQLVGISQTQYNGNYVFGGDSDTQPSYQVDLTSATGVDRLVTTQSTRLIQDANGVVFATSLTAQQIFDNRNADDTPADNNVFAAVNALRVALANNDTDGIATAMTSLNTASSYLNDQLSFYGNVQDRITSALDVAQKYQTQDQAAISSRQDADIATVATELTQLENQQQAALSAESQRPQTSLFNYLPPG
jgi:flagellar hook-associated protein 3 FlgL